MQKDYLIVATKISFCILLFYIVLQTTSII
jgi:hypothetical protein